MPTNEPVEGDDRAELPAVNAHCLSTERTVFTEQGNEDGWISTDLTVEVRR
ncbi:hypothetical protein [Halolamina salina]|uniref:Uncharacterized protein n=1 Tax=Halolamina salina TaxID=1220023 RepID=A0ABD6B780_9EURY